MKSYRKIDLCLLGLLFFPLLSCLFLLKWTFINVVGTTDLSGWTLFEFIRLHGSYYVLLFLWTMLMLFNSARWRWTMRVMAIFLFLYFTFLDLSTSATVQVTGVSAPYGSAIYSGSASGNAAFPMSTMVLITMVVFPLMFVIAAILKYRIINPVESRAIKIRGFLASAIGICLLLSIAEPIRPFQGELSHLQPAYFYQLDKFIMGVPKSPPPLALNVSPSYP